MLPKLTKTAPYAVVVKLCYLNIIIRPGVFIRGLSGQLHCHFRNPHSTRVEDLEIAVRHGLLNP